MRKRIITGVAVVLLMLVGAGILLGPGAHGFIRERTQKALETHFASSVEFSDFNVALFPRLRVTISGLVLRHKGRTDIPPLIEVKTVTMYAPAVHFVCAIGWIADSYSAARAGR